MATNAGLARIFGSDNDAIYLAPIGTVLPTTIDGPLNGAFEDVGWIHSDGITETLTGSVNKIRGHQGNGVVRTRMNEPGSQIGFTALETKEQTQSLRYHVKSSTTSGGVRRQERGAGQRVQVRSAVIDLFDSDDDTVAERFVIPRFEITANGDRVMAYADIAGFPFLGEIIGDYVHFSTDLEADQS